MESKIVENEWLVVFTSYHDKTERYEIIESALGEIQFTVIPRDNPAQAFKSDFDVIKMEDKTAVSHLHECDDIKSVRDQGVLLSKNIFSDFVQSDFLAKFCQKMGEIWQKMA